MKCSKCGYENERRAKVCLNCGNRLIVSKKDNNNNNNDSDEELSTTAKIIWGFVLISIVFFLTSSFFGEFILEFFISFCAFLFGCN